ncbi:MAG: phospholipid carrier-dependent glycosyltransferase [Alphaproteobacteria bacterium]|nr:phospholipid carrier-dependent glycosyltransferase [Alphaproteobacteria bacterium]
MLEIAHFNVKKSLILITFIFALFFGYEIGNRPFADPDEGRYVEIPREMVVTGDYITPRLNGLKYFEKPPLLYWLQSATIKAVGMNEYSMRFWIVFFAVIGCLSVFLVGLTCKSISTGILSASILATNLLYYAHSRLIILDLVVSVLISGTLWCFFLAFVRKEKIQYRKTIIIAMYALSALACLTKGLIGAILPGFVAFLWICFTNNWRKIREIIYIPGILVFFLIFFPWHVMVCIRNSDFFHFYFVVEHFLRYTTQMHSRYQPAWFFIPIVIVGLLPWTGFALVALKNAFIKIKDSENIFLLCWIFGIFGFYSFSNSKLIPYILPIIPPISYLTAKMLIQTESGATDKNFKIGAWINAFLFGLSFVAFFFAKNSISDVIAEFPEVITLIIAFAVVILMCVLLFLYASFSRKKIDNAIILYIFLAANMMWILNKAAPFYQAVKKPSVKQIAEIVKINRKADDLVFSYKKYQQDLPVYLGSVIGVVDHYGELNFGNQAEKNDRMISEKELIKLWSGEKRIFLVLTRKDYRQFFQFWKLPHMILDFDKNFAVITNK